MWVATTPPPERAALAVHDQVVAFDLDLDAVAAQHRGGGFEPVGFLDAQFLQAAHARHAFGEGRGDGEDRIFVDHGRRALGRHVDALQRAGLDPQIGDVLAALVALLDRLDRSAHLPQRRVEAGAQRIEHHAFQHDLGARHDQRADQRERRRRRIGRHHDRRGFELRLALQRDAAAVLADAGDAQAGAEMLEHLLGVVAGRFLLDHRGRAGRGQARQQHRRLELRRRHRRLVFDRHRIAGALHHRRQAAALANLQRAGAHLLQRIEDAPHRPRAQAGVAVEGHGDRAAGHGAHRQPAAGSGVAEIERRRRLGEAADADAPHPPGPLAGALDDGAERLHGVGGADGVLALQHAGDAGFADRQRAEDQGAQRNRLVAGHAHAAGQRPRAAGGQRRGWDGLVHGGSPASWRSVRRPTTGPPRTLLTAALPAAKGSTTFPRHPDRFKDFRTVAKPELGTKRLCGSCGAKFYDLSKDPIVCPKCGTVFVVVVPVARGRAAEAAAAGGRWRCCRCCRCRARRPRRPRPRRRRPPTSSWFRSRTPTPRPPARRPKASAEGDDDIEVEETEEAPFIEEQEEGDDDVTDIIGEGREDEEET